MQVVIDEWNGSNPPSKIWKVWHSTLCSAHFGILDSFHCGRIYRTHWRSCWITTRPLGVFLFLNTMFVCMRNLPMHKECAAYSMDRWSCCRFRSDMKFFHKKSCRWCQCNSTNTKRILVSRCHACDDLSYWQITTKRKWKDTPSLQFPLTHLMQCPLRQVIVKVRVSTSELLK